jgi:tetrahydromethanopterin S-methyltransferase subunit G
MSSDVFAALCGLMGSVLGGGFGVLAAAKMTNFRLEQLEKKVEKHNNLVERMVVVEQSTKSAHHRLDDLEE